MPKVIEDRDAAMGEKVRPYSHHGMVLTQKNDEAVGDCPFCGRDNKFTVNVTTGQWRCFVCNTGAAGAKVLKGGNVYTFLRLLWEEGKRLLSSSQWQSKLVTLADERRLLSADTLEQWGVVPHPVTGEWCLPGYDHEGKLNNLYRYVKIQGKHRLLCTAELNHCLFGVNVWQDTAPGVFVCEGPWDAMALWEVLRAGKREEGEESIHLTGNPDASLLTHYNVVAVPGCTTFREHWTPLFEGKEVTICFDSDHPKRTCLKCKKNYSLVESDTCPTCSGTDGRDVPPVGTEGVKMVTKAFTFSAEKPKEIRFLDWGGELMGFDPDLPDGHDVRDALSADGDDVRNRFKNLEILLTKLAPIPPSWVQGVGLPHSSHSDGQPSMELLPCHNYKELVDAWKVAFRWFPGLDHGLSFLLSISASTELLGSQLWGMLLGPASSGKTSIAEGLAVNENRVYSKSTIRGFHSGYKSDKEGKEDNSLIVQIQNKTLIIKDADTILSSMSRDTILSEMRDLYDRSTAAHYRHGMSRNYKGLNITIVMCGTAGLRALDSSELGQRFLICEIMKQIDNKMEVAVLDQAINNVFSSNRALSNGKPEGQKPADLIKAMRLTGGYVEYLRANAEALAQEVKVTPDVTPHINRLARFIAHCRARPSKRQDEAVEREIGTRLGIQLARLALCESMVMNSGDVSQTIMERVRKVALDSSSGKVMDIITRLHGSGLMGEDAAALCIKVGDDPNKFRVMLKFLRDVRIAEDFTRVTVSGLQSQPRWRLAPGFKALYDEVMCES